MVGAVGEIAPVKRHKLWKMGEDGLCCSSNATQIQPGPSSLLEERSKTLIVFVVFFVLLATPQNGETANCILVIASTKVMALSCPLLYHVVSPSQTKSQFSKTRFSFNIIFSTSLRSLPSSKDQGSPSVY